MKRMRFAEDVEGDWWMDDLISRQQAIMLFAGDVAAQNELNNLPSAQPEIIACGDCKHWICHDRRCGYWNHGVKPLMWCSQAERRWKE